jgi:hypothetical protein
MTLLGSIVYILQTVAVKLKITIYNYHYIVSFLSFYDCVVLVVVFVFVACVSGLSMFDCPMLPVSLDCPCLIALSVFSNNYKCNCYTIQKQWIPVMLFKEMNEL